MSGLIYVFGRLRPMRRAWAVASVLGGTSLAVYAAAAFAFDLGGPEVSEALGGLSLILGVFFLAEGILTLWRLAILRKLGPGRSPK